MPLNLSEQKTTKPYTSSSSIILTFFADVISLCSFKIILYNAKLIIGKVLLLSLCLHSFYRWKWHILLYVTWICISISNTDLRCIHCLGNYTCFTVLLYDESEHDIHSAQSSWTHILLLWKCLLYSYMLHDLIH
jgi:hypothetical protein